MMRTVHLYGPVADEFGASFELDVATPAEAVRALIANLGSRFRDRIRDGEWHVIAGETLTDGEDYGYEEMLGFGLGKADLHIAPAIHGSGGKGLGQIIVGVLLVTAAVALSPWTGGASLSAAMGETAFTAFGASVTYGSIAAMGAMMAVGGIAQALTPTPKLGGYGARESAEERPSFLFTGPKNTTEQGGPVPVVYGRHRVGWTLISSGVEVEQI